MLLRILLPALALACIPTSSGALTTFIDDIAAIGASPRTITFDEFALGTNYVSGVPRPPNPLDPAALPVPGHDVHLQSSLGMTTGDFDAFFGPNTVPDFFEGSGTFNPAGSGLSQLFQVRFDTPVSAAGLVIFNNFGTTPRNYALRVYDATGATIGVEDVIAVVATPEFIGFTSTNADIALLELGIGPTFNTGRRPFIDTITYVAEPGTALLLGCGVVASALSRRAARGRAGVRRASLPVMPRRAARGSARRR